MKPLSTNNISNALVFPVLLFLISTPFAVAGAASDIAADKLWIYHPLSIFIYFILLLLWIGMAAFHTYNLRYDDEFLYLDGIIDSKKVPLSTIKKIERSTDGVRVKGLTSWKYTIEFHPGSDVSTQTAFEVIGTEKVSTFVVVVKKVNPALLAS